MQTTVELPEPIKIQHLQGLVSFLYVLLRDHLPAGCVESIMVDHVEKSAGQAAEYSNPHIAEYARELAARLIKETETRMSLTVNSELRLPREMPAEVAMINSPAVYTGKK